ncbi:MAG: hypothetical protein IT306_26440 [Chloroflexi bacterium]|nr:hypothetical protein [Chloroflexota bacterium]
MTSSSTRGRQALDQQIEERLGLRIDPMEILDDRHQWVLQALLQQQQPRRVKGLLATLSRGERCPGSAP